jgi:microcystin-dependent protein
VHSHQFTALQGQVVAPQPQFTGGAGDSWVSQTQTTAPAQPGITVSAATLPAGNGNTNFKSQQGYGTNTGVADRSLAVMSQGADRSLTTGSVGSGAGHNNMPPFCVVNFIIKT